MFQTTNQIWNNELFWFIPQFYGRTMKNVFENTTVRNGCWVVATTQCGRLPLPDSCQVLGCNGFHNWCFFKQVACLTWEFSAKHKIENSEKSEGTGFLFLFLNHHQLIRKLGVKMKMCLLPGKLIFSEHQIWGTVRYANPTWRLVVLNQQAMEV